MREDNKLKHHLCQTLSEETTYSAPTSCGRGNWPDSSWALFCRGREAAVYTGPWDWWVGSWSLSTRSPFSSGTAHTNRGGNAVKSAKALVNCWTSVLLKPSCQGHSHSKGEMPITPSHLGTHRWAAWPSPSTDTTALAQRLCPLGLRWPPPSFPGSGTGRLSGEFAEESCSHSCSLSPGNTHHLGSSMPYFQWGRPGLLHETGVCQIWDSVLESACNAGGLDSIPGWRRSPGKGNDSPVQYSCLENSVDRGAWQATVHRVAKSRTRLSNWHTH